MERELVEPPLHVAFGSPCLIGEVQEAFAVVVDHFPALIDHKQRIVVLGLFCETVFYFGIAHADFALQALGCFPCPRSTGP